MKTKVDNFVSIYEFGFIVLAILIVVALIQIIGSIFYKRILITISKDVPSINFENYKQNQSNVNSFIKRSIEVLMSSVLLFVLAPIFTFIALMIKIDSHGPVIVKTKKKGKDGQKIYIYKFRVFKTNVIRDESNFPKKNDSRYTKFGKFLVLTSLADLPKLYNILKGDISFVGRSPILDFEDTKNNIPAEIYEELLKIKPGLTSLYGVSKDAVEFQKDHILNYDIYYLINRSVWLDIKILLSSFVKTAGIVAEYDNEV